MHFFHLSLVHLSQVQHKVVKTVEQMICNRMLKYIMKDLSHDVYHLK
jgi:hypothetical protein